MKVDFITYLTRDDTRRLVTEINPVEIMRELLIAHAGDQTTVPGEATLRWLTLQGNRARCVIMPGQIRAGGVTGVKVINRAFVPSVDGPVATGLTLLIDSESAQIFCVMAADVISAVRTAAVSIAAVEALSSGLARELTVIGAGRIGETHISLAASRMPQLERVVIYDVDQTRAESLASRVIGEFRIAAHVATSAEEAVRATRILITATTTTKAYVEMSWLQPGTVFVNVSLDDPLPEVFERADRLFVDDVDLIFRDEYRIMGQLLRAGRLTTPGHGKESGTAEITGTLGQLFSGATAGRQSKADIVLVNPFGLGIEDLAMAAALEKHARELGLGIRLPV